MTTPTAVSYDDFLANITATLTKNGYPQRRVALPLERMYETAYNKQLNFNKALAMLEERGISHEKTTEKVIFFPTPAVVDQSASGNDMADMMAKASEMLKNMSPEQIAELQKMVGAMSDEDKAKMMQQAKDMGLAP